MNVNGDVRQKGIRGNESCSKAGWSGEHGREVEYELNTELFAPSAHDDHDMATSH